MRWLLFVLCLGTASHISAKELVITFGGDVNFNRSNQVPLADGVKRYGKTYKWAELTEDIKHLFDGDLNFINLETVLTDKAKLEPAKKRYLFRSHPNSLKHLSDLGVNLVSLANNHAYDYRYEGFAETLKNVDTLPIEHAGIGKLPRLFRPQVFAYQDVVVAFHAMTFLEVPYPATKDKAGVLDANNPDHWNKVIKAFGKSKADIKILSLHKGLERKISVEPGMRSQLRKAVKEGDLNLVLAHHPHVARGIERVDDDSLIFYGLGNFLMLGARNMGPLEDAKDFGLFGRVFIQRDQNREWRISAAQVTPLTDMHLKPRPMKVNAARKRINHLNKLSKKTSGNKAVSFNVQSTANGVACFSEPYGEGAKILCADKKLPRPKPKPAVRRYYLKP